MNVTVAKNIIQSAGKEHVASKILSRKFQMKKEKKRIALTNIRLEDAYIFLTLNDERRREVVINDKI